MCPVIVRRTRFPARTPTEPVSVRISGDGRLVDYWGGALASPGGRSEQSPGKIPTRRLSGGGCAVSAESLDSVPPGDWDLLASPTDPSSAPTMAAMVSACFGGRLATLMAPAKFAASLAMIRASGTVSAATLPALYSRFALSSFSGTRRRRASLPR